MTLAELEVKVARLEAELNVLRHELLRLRGGDVIPGIGPVGTFRDDPTFADAARLGREYRDEVNREPEQAGVRKKAKPRKSDARP